MIKENEIDGGSVVERVGELADRAKRLQFFFCYSVTKKNLKTLSEF